MKPGIHKNLNFADYLKIDAFSASLVGPILRSVRHMEQYRLDGVSSDQVTMGSLVDCLVLEPDKFADYFQMTPEYYENAKKEKKPWDLRSSTCRAMKAQIEATGRRIVTAADLDTANKIKENIYQHKTAREFLIDSESQVSLVWDDPETGVRCKGRIDIMCDGSICDLKTTYDASPSGFSRHMVKFNYHCQAALYVAGWAALNAGEMLLYNFVVVETNAPYCVATYSLGEDSLLAGEFVYRKALKKYQDYKDTGVALGYSEFLEPIDIPVWASAKILEQGEV